MARGVIKMVMVLVVMTMVMMIAMVMIDRDDVCGSDNAEGDGVGDHQ